MKKIIAFLILVVVTLSIGFSACNSAKIKNSEELSYTKELMNMEGAEAVLGTTKNEDSLTKFAAELISACYDGKNTLVSPLSLYLVLAMVANGAEGDTLDEMLSVMGLTLDELNEYCGYLYGMYAENELYSDYVKIADAIWFKDQDIFNVKENFLNINSAYYGADIYKSDFSEKTVKDINAWVNKNTDGLIKKLINGLDKDAIMVLVNTLLFEMKWSNKDYKTSKTTFTSLDGTQSTVNAFDGKTVVYSYSDTAKAFNIYFDGGDKRDELSNEKYMELRRNGMCARFSFMAILPNEGVSIIDYMEDFDGEEFNKLLYNTDNTCDVYYKVPEFEYDYEVNLKDILIDMGMASAFEPWIADFSKMYEINPNLTVYIGQALQKTHIELDKNGVKAAAATAVIMGGDSAAEPVERDKLYLYLDRPFVYCIYDSEYNVPLFIGAVSYL